LAHHDPGLAPGFFSQRLANVQAIGCEQPADSRTISPGRITIPGYDSALYSNNQRYLQLLVPESVRYKDQLPTVFQLDPAEAIVLIGLTPPPDRYFGFTPFLSKRVMPDGKKQPR
jgi:hypothetical protein